MVLTNGIETVYFPCTEYKNWSWPTLEFMQGLGFSEVLPPAAPTPTIAESKAAIKSVRDNILRIYSEKWVIYQPNYDAAASILAGNGDTYGVPSGVTANQFAAANATAMGMPSAAYWAGYIVGEWQRLGAVVDAMEREYLRLTYNPITGMSTMNEAVAAAAAAEYGAIYGQ